MPAQHNVTYRKGPLGYAVVMDGKPVGRIASYQRNHGRWQVNVPGLNAANATQDGKLFRGVTTFPTLAQAKKAVEWVLLSSITDTAVPALGGTLDGADLSPAT